VAGTAQTELRGRALALSDSTAWQGAGLSLNPASGGELRGSLEGLHLSGLQAESGSGALHIGPGVWLEAEDVVAADNSPADLVCEDGEVALIDGGLDVMDGQCGTSADGGALTLPPPP
jgi:hypothetical protein